ncbi:hypothetical protein M0804_002761 [Polistes exclamans]|nr:hypothetical protein M0804_002761 [Polistes exclamans]
MTCLGNLVLIPTDFVVLIFRVAVRAHRRRYSSTSSSSSSSRSDVDAPDRHRREESSLIPFERILKEMNSIDPKTNQLKDRSDELQSAEEDNIRLTTTTQMFRQLPASLLEPILNKDKRLVEKQQKIYACLSALGPSVSDLLREKVRDTPKMVGMLSNTARISVDLQRDEQGV